MKNKILWIVALRIGENHNALTDKGKKLLQRLTENVKK